MRISSDGKVGIGAETPSHVLDIHFPGSTDETTTGTPANSNPTSDIAKRVHWGIRLACTSLDTTDNIGGGSGIKFQSKDTIYDERYAGICGISEANYGNKVGLSFWTSHTASNGNGIPKESMRISSDGKVGIAIKSPAFPLDVRTGVTGAAGSIWDDTDRTDGAWIGTNATLDGAFSSNGTGFGTNNIFYAHDLDNPGVSASHDVDVPKITAHFQYSIYVSNGGIMFSSDERIKCNIKNLDDKLGLEIIRKIETKTYNYSDFRDNGRNLEVGFIAQNVKEYFPNAVTLVTRYIPNILKLINVSWQSFTENNKTKYKMSTTDLTDIIGIKYKFYVDNSENGSNEKEIEVIGNSDNTFTFDEKYNYVFCYGKEVDDFHSLDKNKIFVLHHSGIQELDRQQIADKKRITNLESKINILETENEQQQNEINTLKTENQQQQTKINELTSIIDKLKTANSFEEFKNSL